MALTLLAVLVGAAPAPGAAPSAEARLAASSDGMLWSWPLWPPLAIARPFLAPATRYSSGHRGVDLRGEEGAPVLAPADGVVHFSGFVVDRPLVSIRHPDGLISSFEPVASELVAGTPVLRGDTIGALQSGHCPAPCLHLGVRRHGEYVSPLNYLGGIPRSILLPTRPLR